MSAKQSKKKPRKLAQKLYNLLDKLKFHLKISPKFKLVIVSGANSSHFRSLVQFIKSVLHYERHSELVIYDLGLTQEESDFIKNNFPNIDMRVFDYSKYPSYFNVNINAGYMAWKPVIVSDVLNEFKCPVIWMDAGSLITQPLYQIRDVIKKHSFYSPVSKGAIEEWTHPKTIEYLNVENNLLNARNLNAGIVAVDSNCSEAMQLVEKWRQCALVKECIAPKNSSQKNHRQDQSILTILAYQFGFAQRIPQRCLGFKVHQDID